MASILKVDQIQTAAGGTPTAADLGLNVTGSVLQVVTHDWSVETNSTSTSFIDVNGSSYSFTPKFSNSKILIQGFISIRFEAATASGGGGIRPFWNGSSILDDTTYIVYDDDADNTYFRHAFQATVTANTTSPTIVKLQSALYSNGNFWVNWGGNNTSSFTIFEIAG